MHLRSFSKVAHLYDNQNPSHLETYRRRAEDVAGRFSQPQRAALADALASYMKATGAADPALRQVERLRHPEAVAVVTGQQAGLFLGPLFSLYKALSAIGLAARLEEDLNRPVVPIFWIASEDHDFAEVDHAYIVDADEEIRRVRLATEAPLYQMVYHHGLTSEVVDEVLAEVHRLLPDTPFKAECLRELRGNWHPGMSLATWFARIFNELLSEYGLILLDPCLPALRQLAKPVFVNTLEHLADIRRELNSVYAQVEDLGLPPAVACDVRNTTLFYVQGGKRYVLETDDTYDNLTARHLGLSQSRMEWLALAESYPTAFSSNVLLRPVVQDYIVPTLCYVGGPAEVAYFPLSAGVFHAHGLSLPPVVLRQRMTLVPPSVQRSMERYKVSSDIFEEPQSLVADVLERQGGADIEAYMSRLEQESRARWQQFAETFAHYGPQVHRLAEIQAEKEHQGIRRVQRKTEYLLEERLASEVRRLKAIEIWLWTDGHQQERRLSLLSFWARFGKDWIRQLPMWSDYQCQGVVYHVDM